MPLRPPSAKAGRKTLETLTVEAVYVPTSADTAAGAQCQFWGRLHSNLSLSILLPDLATLIAASHFNDVERHSKRKRTHHAKRSTVPAQQPIDPDDYCYQNTAFMQSLDTLDSILPPDSPSFYKNGFQISRSKVPRPALYAYRKGLDTIARAIIADSLNPKHWKLLLLYDALVLAPPTEPITFADSIRQRVARFLAGDWAPLIRDLQTVSSNYRPPWPYDRRSGGCPSTPSRPPRHTQPRYWCSCCCPKSTMLCASGGTRPNHSNLPRTQPASWRRRPDCPPQPVYFCARRW